MGDRIMVFDIEELRFLWHCYVTNGYRLLGEVDTAKGHIAYVRKVLRESGPTVSLMVHALRTGEVTRSVTLQAGSDLTAGDIFFIVVSDASFHRLTVLYEAQDTPMYNADEVTLRLYSLADESGYPSGALITQKVLHHSQEPYISPQHFQSFSADLYMDYPPRLDRFDIAESYINFCEFDGLHVDPIVPISDQDDPFSDYLRLAILAPSLQVPIPLLPKHIPFSAWSLQPSKSGEPEFTHTRYLSSTEHETDIYRDWYQWNIWHAMCSPRDACAPPNWISRRFEVFMPLEQTSVVCVSTRYDRVGVSIVTWQPAREILKQEWAGSPAELRNMLRSRESDSDSESLHDETGSSHEETPRASARPDILMEQATRRPLRAWEGMEEVVAETNVTGGKPYEVQKSGEIWLKGELPSCFLHHVQWGDSMVVVRTKWRDEIPEGVGGDIEDPGLERGVADAVVVFDFNPPW